MSFDRQIKALSYSRITTGVVHWVDGSFLIKSCGNDIFTSRNGGESFEWKVRLPTRGSHRIASSLRLGRRLLRTNIRHCVRCSATEFLIFVNGEILRLDIERSEIRVVAPIHRRRPLAVCQTGDTLYYGEYFGNKNREPVKIWASLDEGATWECVRQLTGVRHIHGVYSDPYEKAIWMTTGDRNDEVNIFRTEDNFRTLSKVGGGRQEHRVVDLLFSEDAVWFGSDGPEIQNHIYQLDRASQRIEKMQAVQGPVFFGHSIGNRMFFSTVVEPSKVNRHAFAQVWTSNGGERWSCLTEFRASRLHSKMFGYAQVFFPNGPGTDDGVWLSPYAAKFDQQSLFFAATSESNGPTRVVCDKSTKN